MNLKLVGWTFLLAILLCNCSSILASHIVGVDIQYERIGPCTYRISLTQYYDCAGSFMVGYLPVSASFPPPPPSLGGNFSIAGIGSCSPPTPLGGSFIFLSYEEVTPLCPSAWNQPGGLHPTACDDPLNPSPFINGIVASTYYVDYNFCSTNCSDYLITFSDCCRNSIITSGAAGAPIFLQSFMNIDSMNSSPIYANDPVFLLCNDGLIQVPLDGIDPDGDSLVYSMVDCSASSGVPVGYDPGYSSQVPLGPTWNVSLDSLTGLLTLTPNGSGAGAQVVGVVCVEILEYRNGVQVGLSTRDFQITILPNCSNSTPSIGPMQLLGGGSQSAADTLQTCLGSLLHFQIAAIDPDLTDTLTLISDIDQILPGAMVSFSGINPAIIDVSWTADSSDLDQIYAFVLDANDLICPLPGTAQRAFYIEVSTPCISALLTDIACQDSTGLIDLTVVGDSGAIYSYLWSTGDTTEDLQGLSVGSYWVDVFDGVGQLFSTDTFFVNATDISLIPTFTIPDCGASDGQIDLAVTGGMMPYSYSWSDGSTMSSLADVPFGGYSVTVSDVNGCPRHAVYFLEESDSCFVSVSGTAFHDLNGNCVQDSNELGIPYLYIELTPGGAAFTDQNGNYTILLDTGTYVLEIQPAPGMYWAPLCPVNGQHNLSFGDYAADTSGVDFAMDILPVQDLRVVGNYFGTQSPGSSFLYQLQIYNDGSLPSHADWSLQMDSLMHFSNMYVGSGMYNPSTHVVSGSINSLAPGQQSSITIAGQQDTSTMLGDLLISTSTVMPIAGDTTPNNNVHVDNTVVVAAYDPNDKRVSPKGDGPEGFIQASQNEMHYTVRFQNTGTFPAQYVIIRDTIHPNLDLSSYRPMTHSHTYTLSVEEDSILVFRFDNINLPDSASDLDGSQGHVSYQLLHEGTLSPGDRMTNSAGIYFDFNAPVITSQVLNTINFPTAIEDGFASSVEVFPNPFAAQTLIRFANPSQASFDLVLMDVRGKVVRRIQNIHSDEIVLHRGALSEGLYLFRLSGKGQSYSGKLIIGE